MKPVYFHPDASQGHHNAQPASGDAPARPGQPNNRLNLLLSHAAWQKRHWADALEPLLAPMGIQAHRAPDARTASRVMESTPIHLAIVDLAIPLEHSNPLAEAGWKVLEFLAAANPNAHGSIAQGPHPDGAPRNPPPIVVVRRARSQREQAQEMNAALRLGAFAVIDPPKQPSDLELLLEVLRRALTRHYQGKWPTQSEPRA